MVKVHQLRVGPNWMDPLVSFLKNGGLPDRREKLRKYKKGVSLLVFQGAETKTLLLYTIFTLIHLKVVHYWKSCMKESMLVIWEESPYCIGLSLKVTSGRVCRKWLEIIPRSVTSVRDSLRASINLEAC